MIISASRRTDIPRFYIDWFIKRLQAGEVYVRNPRNYHQVSRIDLSKEYLDCIVFWTKNPQPMLAKLELLKDYPYYIQFTINPYQEDLESNLPSKQELLHTFQQLSKQIGPERVVWRYSPVIINDIYTIDYHLQCFKEYAKALQGYTKQCNLSFLEMYSKISHSMKQQGIAEIPEDIKNTMAKEFMKIAEHYDIALRACGNIDLQQANIPPAKCIDNELIEKITGLTYSLKKDPNQPKDCYCVSSMDVGTYNTCLNGCVYCYANQVSLQSTERKSKNFDSSSPILCSTLTKEDTITNRKVKKEGSRQLRLF